MSQASQSWGNLVGKDGSEAVETIKKDTGFTNVHTLQENSPMTMDYRTNRVRVIVNEQGKVVSVPTVG